MTSFIPPINDDINDENYSVNGLEKWKLIQIVEDNVTDKFYYLVT